MTDKPTSNIRRIRPPAHHLGSAGRRMRANLPAELRAGSMRFACQVIDISVGGARLKMTALPPPDLATAWLILDPFGPIEAETVWRDRDCVGVRFLQERREIAELQAQRFDPAAWLGTAGSAGGR
jgi:hypothetical protein